MRKQLFILTLIVLFGTWLRVNLPNRELWYDEAFTAKITKNSYSDIIRLSFEDVHPPLFYLVAKPFNNQRVPSLIFGVGTILVTFLLVSYVKKDKALLATAGVAVNPFLIAYSNEARSYSMLAFLTVLMCYFLIRAWKEEKYLGLAITLSLMFCTHYITLLFLPVCLIFLESRKAFIHLLLIAFTLMLILPQALKPRNDAGLKWIPEVNKETMIGMVNRFTLGYDNANTVQPYFDRFLIGVLTLAFILVVVSIPAPLTLLYATLCVVLIVSYKPTTYGNKSFLDHVGSLDRPVVMTDATAYIEKSYYAPNIKLQRGDWSNWVVIKPEDIYDYKKDFYLVNKGQIGDWGCSNKFGEFCFYEWNL